MEAEFQRYSYQGILPLDCNQQLSVNNKLHELIYIPVPDNSSQLNQPRIVATIGCSSEELQYLKQTLISLHDNDFDTIYFNCPETYFNNSYDLIPEWITNICKVTLIPPSQNILGNFNKILPLLDYEKNPDTIIVSLDTGIIYPNGMVRNIIAAFKRFPESAHAPKMFKFKSVNYYQPVSINGNVGDIYDSSYGISFKRSFLKRDFTSYVNLLIKRGCYHECDNLLITNYLLRYKIPVRCICRKFYNTSKIQLLTRKPQFYSNTGLNLTLINKHRQIVQLLQQIGLLALRNPHTIAEAIRHLTSGKYFS